MSATAELVVLYVEERGPATIGEIRDELDISLLQLYPITSNLVNHDRVERDGDTLHPVD